MNGRYTCIILYDLGYIFGQKVTLKLLYLCLYFWIMDYKIIDPERERQYITIYCTLYVQSYKTNTPTYI